MNTFITFIKKPVIFITIIIVIVLGAGLILSQNKKNNDNNVLPVATTTPENNTVKISGRVRAAQDVDLSVRKTGRVITVNKKVGSKVSSEEIIIATDAADLDASYQQAQATLAKERAKLEQLTTSARPEEIAIAESQLSSAQADYLQKFTASYNVVDNAIRNTVDQFINSPTSAASSFNFPVADQELARSLAYDRYNLEAKLVKLYNALPTSTNSTQVPESVYNLYSDTLSDVSSYIARFAIALNSLTSSASYPQSTISGWKTDISNARTNVVVASQNIIAARTQVAVNANELAIKKNVGNETEIKAQEAAILGAQAQIANVQAQINDTLIRAPFSGVVTRLDADLGQTVQANTNIVSMISEGAYQIEANIPEVSVSRVEVGNKASVTLDAFGSKVVFDAEVISLDLSEKVIDGVPSYMTKLRLVTTDDRIKSGMTANVTISVNSK